MPRKKSDIFYIYKTICLITGKYYIGMHATANINDGYLGSGLRLRHSIRKYGKENHVKEILEFLPTRELLVKREKELITTVMLCDNECMNLMSGGTGGYISVEQQKHRSKCASMARKKKLETDPVFFAEQSKKISEGIKLAYQQGRILPHGGGWNKGKEMAEEHKSKIGKANAIKQKGELNSQYGKSWVTKNGENQSVLKEHVNEYIQSGWALGKCLLQYELVCELKKSYTELKSYKKVADKFGLKENTIIRYIKNF